MSRTRTQETVFPVADYGARGRAVRTGELTCPRREHAGWRPGPPLRAEQWGEDRTGSPGSDTAGIQAAIDAAAARGGGRVVVGPGDYLIRPIRLKTGVHLHLEKGATLHADPSPEAYPDNKMLNGADFDARFQATGGTGHSGMLTGEAFDLALIQATDAENVTLTGPGTISAQGGVWFLPWWAADKAFLLRRPMRFVEFRNCRGVVLEDLHIRDSCGWTVVFSDCRDVTARRLDIRNFHGPNVDGINVVDSRNVLVEDCDVFTTDDALCLKSRHPDGRTENVTIRNCRVRTFCNAFKIGSETLGTIRGVKVTGLTVRNEPDDILRAESAINLGVLDGGIVEDVEIEDVTAKDARNVFQLSSGRRSLYQTSFRNPLVSRLRRILLRNIRARGAEIPCVISGNPDSPIEDCRMDDVEIALAGGFRGPPPAAPPEDPEAYPTINHYGPLPASGLWARHVRNLDTCGLRFTFAEKDDRPRIYRQQPIRK